MVSINHHLKTVIFCHQIGSAHKNVITVCKHQIGLYDRWLGGGAEAQEVEQVII